MSIQRLEPAHAAEYRSLMLQAYEHHPDAFTSSYAEREILPLSWWESRLINDSTSNSIVFGVFQNRKLAGVVGLSFNQTEKTRHKVTLFGLYIAAEYRCQGYGRLLLETALSHADLNARIKVIQLTVTEGNQAARSLYEKCGFVVFGIEPMAVAVGAQFVSKIHLRRQL